MDHLPNGVLNIRYLVNRSWVVGNVIDATMCAMLGYSRML